MARMPEFSASASLEARSPLPRQRPTRQAGIRSARAAPPPAPLVAAPSVGSIVLLASFGQAMPASVTEADAVMSFDGLAEGADDLSAVSAEAAAGDFEDGSLTGDAGAGDVLGGEAGDVLDGEAGEEVDAEAGDVSGGDVEALVEADELQDFDAESAAEEVDG